LADARELWDKHYDETQKFSVIREILPNCSSAEILKEKYDFDMPGRNGIVYVIQTNNSELLREEIISHINNIIILHKLINSPFMNWPPQRRKIK